MSRGTLTLATLAAVALGTAACAGSVDVNGAGQLALQTATSPASALSAAEHTINLNGNVLVITSAQLVAREIELEAEDGACAGVDSTSDACSEVEVGPVLLDLPLTAGAAQQVNATVAAGTFNEVKFKIHTPDNDDAADQAFRAAHPEFANASVRVSGTFNGTPFTYTSAVDAEQEIHFPQPIVTTDAAVSLTLFVDVDQWFLTADGTAIIDPALLAGSTELTSVVDGNIKASFQAFEDNDHDGADDHSGEQSGTAG